VWTQGDVDVAADARLSAPLLLGAGTRIGARASVERAVLGPGASVGAGSAIDTAVVLAGCRVEAGSRVTRAVIGPDGLLAAPDPAPATAPPATAPPVSRPPR
jgi:NDP-sugar pyrophosphorylase family protein